jgi:alkanesulfonate monooxygenase SsuD/methylene tetrahydromethanopterin reductase-like flavin-dependent oxidoreductase (luciferase family)
MAKALYGHVGNAPDRRILDEVTRLRSRVQALEFEVTRDRIGAQRGWPPLQRNEFESEIARGSMYLGSPETVAKKIAATVKALGVGRFDLIYSSGTTPVGARTRAVELYGTKVIPMVRDILAS